MNSDTAVANSVKLYLIRLRITIGKLAAILLMFVGIGFIDMLTSAITSFFTTDTEKSKNQQLLDQLELVTKQNEEIKKRLAAIEQQTRK